MKQFRLPAPTLEIIKEISSVPIYQSGRSVEMDEALALLSRPVNQRLRTQGQIVSAGFAAGGGDSGDGVDICELGFASDSSTDSALIDAGFDAGDSGDTGDTSVDTADTTDTTDTHVDVTLYYNGVPL
jgi:hypothetical protein